MNDELAVLFAKRFIQRRDIKAVQLSFPDKVIYTPDREMRNPGKHGPVGWQMQHLHQHLTGEATYGHYMLDDDSQARLFAFDIDLKANDAEFTGSYVANVEQMTNDEAWLNPTVIACDPREAWHDRAHPGRGWFKLQMGMLARKFVSQIQSELGIGCAAAYSGNKGIHVYGFTGALPAEQVRAAAIYVLESLDDWEPLKGEHFFQHKLQDPIMGYPNFSVEVFPKQDSLNGKDLGNLMRLPLGKNLKHPDPTFFLDLNTPVGVFAPHPNPVQLLETGNPYLDPA